MQKFESAEEMFEGTSNGISSNWISSIDALQQVFFFLSFLT